MPGGQEEGLGFFVSLYQKLPKKRAVPVCLLYQVCSNEDTFQSGGWIRYRISVDSDGAEFEEKVSAADDLYPDYLISSAR